jgi:hypothetical protein
MLAALALCNSAAPGMVIAGKCIQIGTAVGESPRKLVNAAALVAQVRGHLAARTARFPKEVRRLGPVSARQCCGALPRPPHSHLGRFLCRVPCSLWGVLRPWATEFRSPVYRPAL